MERLTFQYVQLNARCYKNWYIRLSTFVEIFKDVWYSVVIVHAFSISQILFSDLPLFINQNMLFKYRQDIKVTRNVLYVSLTWNLVVTLVPARGLYDEKYRFDWWPKNIPYCSPNNGTNSFLTDLISHN